MPEEELSQEDIDAMLADTGQQTPPPPASQEEGPSQPLDMPDFGAPQDDSAQPPGADSERTFDLLKDVNLNVKIELGKCQMVVEDILSLTDGSVVSLDKLAGDPVDVLVNEKLVARGEVVVINDVFCVRVTEILDPKQRLIALK